jgi:hypothetical protein
MDLVRYFALVDALAAGETDPATEWRRILSDAEEGRHLNAWALAATVRALGVPPQSDAAVYVSRRLAGTIKRGQRRTADFEIYPPFLVDRIRREFEEHREYLKRLRQSDPDAYRQAAAGRGGIEEAALHHTAAEWEISPRVLWRLLHGRDDYRNG